MIRVFLPPASYIEQLVSVPGKSSARRFSPEKTGFSLEIILKKLIIFMEKNGRLIERTASLTN